MSWKVVLFLSILLTVETGNSFWDTAARKAEEAAKAAAVASAISDIISQIRPDTEAEKRLKYLQRENERLSQSMKGLIYLKEDTRGFLEGPDFSSSSLEDQLRAASDYIRRGNHLMNQAMLLGAEGVSAVNGIYTNITLGEIQKNQTILISQNERSELLKVAKEIEETKSWQNFISRQKTLRETLYKSKAHSSSNGSLN